MNILYIIALIVIFALVLVLGAVVLSFFVAELGRGREPKRSKPKSSLENDLQDEIKARPEEQKRLSSFEQWLKERDEESD